jgi:3-dehydroquinate dehydratase II
MKILIINGPNLNILGKREPAIYGSTTLNEIIKTTTQELANLPVELEWYHSNHEGEIIDKLHEADQMGLLGVVINPGGYSHSSVAILDALKALTCLKIEVHLTNTHAREEFRKTRITASGVDFVLEGLKRDTYTAAVSILYKMKESLK